MKLIFYLIIPLFFCLNLDAQEKFPDSLKNATNCEKINFYNAKVTQHQWRDSSLYYIEKSLLFYKDCENDSIQIATVYNEAFYYFQTSNYKNSIVLFENINRLAIDKNQDYYRLKATTFLGKCHIMVSHNEKGIEYYKKALDIAEEMKDSLYIADAYNNIGDMYITLDMHNKAKKYLLKALDMYETINVDEAEKYITYKSLAYTVKNKQEIEHYFELAANILKKENNPRKLALFYLTKGDALSSKEFYKECFLPFQKAYTIADSINFGFVKYISLMGMALSYNHQGEYKKAIDNLEEALDYDQAYSNNYYILLDELSTAYYGNKNYKKAYETSKKLSSIRDSIGSKKQLDSYIEFDAKFKTAQKDKEIAQQQLELSQNEVEISRQKSTRNKWVYGSLGFLLLGFTLFQRRSNKQKQEKLVTETKYQKEQEINQLRTKFLGNISHEIRTPLTLISGNLELAKDNIKDEAKLIKNINAALSNSKKVIHDANEILDLLKFDKKKATIQNSVFHLDKTLRRIFLSFSSLAEMKHLELKYQSNISEKKSINTDLEKVEKILNNLVSNAIKYSPSNSKIIFDATLDAKSQLIIKVTDFGQGISFNETKKIFERFYQSTENQSIGGIGIGLSLAKEFAELLKGSLSVESEVGNGSTFIFTMPIETSVVSTSSVDGQNEARRSEEPLHVIKTDPETSLEEKISSTNKNKPPSASSNYRKPKILIVEDNPEMSSYLVEILSGNYHCSVAFDGIEALEKIKANSYDLITSDIMMPKLDGFQLRDKINQEARLKDIPYILISAKTLEEDKIKGFQLGIDDYIVKPFNKNELLARIKNLLNNKYSREKWEKENKETENRTDLPSDKKLIKKIEAIIYENISNENFKVEQLASALGYSNRQVIRLLKKHTGMSPVKFILEVRLQNAYLLIQNKTHFTLSEVRYDVGILTSSYFNRKFKERFGINPSELLS